MSSPTRLFCQPFRRVQSSIPKNFKKNKKYFKKSWIMGGVSDSWGFAFEFYPKDRALTIAFIHWYVIIEKDYK